MINILSTSYPLVVGVLEEDENTYLKTRHCKERSDVAISLTHSVILRSLVTLTGRRENLILLNLYEEKKTKEDEVLTRKSTAQDAYAIVILILYNRRVTGFFEKEGDFSGLPTRGLCQLSPPFLVRLLKSLVGS